MRIFLIWPAKGPGSEVGELMNGIEKHGHKIVYWVGRPEAAEYRPAGAVFHSYIDAINAEPAENINPYSFAPPSKNLIHDLRDTEAITLTMMNGFPFYDRLCTDERRRIYYTMLRYWLGVLKEYKPDAVIFPNTPHFIYNYVLYHLARYLGIKTVVFYDSRIPGRLIRLDDFKQGCVPLQKELRAMSQKQIYLSDLPDDIRRYYEKITAKNLSEAPSYIKELKKKHSFYIWLFTEPKIRQSIRDLTIFMKLPRFIFYMMKNRGPQLYGLLVLRLLNLFRSTPKREYLKVARFLPDFSRDFIYFPLQVQPEATTIPHGDVFSDQILALETLSFCLPSGWTIYVKEHPMQWLRAGNVFSSNRYKGYYKRLSVIPGVKIIPLETESYSLIDRSRAIATITGSAAWEAVLRGKPAVIFGHPWFQDLTGLLGAHDADSCKEAIQKIQEGLSVSQNETLKYLVSLGRVSIRAFYSPISGKYSGLTREESTANIVKEITRELG